MPLRNHRGQVTSDSQRIHGQTDLFDGVDVQFPARELESAVTIHLQVDQPGAIKDSSLFSPHRSVFIAGNHAVSMSMRHGLSVIVTSSF